MAPSKCSKQLSRGKKIGAVAMLLKVCARDCNLAKDTSAGASGDGPHNDAIALHFHELTLRSSDIQLLQGGHELNQRLLSFDYAYLQHVRYKTASAAMLFVAPAVAQCMCGMDMQQLRRVLRLLKADSKSFVFFPLGSQTAAEVGSVVSVHWSLLLLSRPDRKFYYYDSQDYSNMARTRALHATLRGALPGMDFGLVVGRCLQQRHDCDSGVHVVCMTDYLANYVLHCGYASGTLLVAAQEVRGMRTALLQLIQTLGGLAKQRGSRY